MSSFTEGVVVLFERDTDLARIYHSFYYHIGSEDSGDWVFIEKGFPTDGNSRPWFLDWVFPRWGRYTKAAVVHDSLYAHPWAYVSRLERAMRMTRQEADSTFREALEVLGCPKWKRELAYRLLRMFGGWAWRKHRKQDIGAVKTEKLINPDLERITNDRSR